VFITLLTAPGFLPEQAGAEFAAAREAEAGAEFAPAALAVAA
jgi:hypothetical protein